MSSSIVPALVAPDMGSFEQGVGRFKATKPPYARGGGTPSTQLLEKACLTHLAKWDRENGGAEPSIAIVSSGQAANHVVFSGLRGGNLVSSSHLFGTTKVDLKMTFGRAGGQIAYVDPCDTQAFIDNTTEHTNAWFLEAISNPAGRVADLSALRQAAKERNIALVVDATLAVGMPGFKGIDLADIMTVSLTKQAGGGTNKNTGGAIIVNNNFPWAAQATRFPELREYFANAAGDVVLPDSPFAALVSKISLHEGSGVISPANAVSIATSLPGMEGRVQRQNHNALLLAKMLTDHPEVKSLQLAGFSTDEQNDARARQYLGDNHFVLLVELKGGADAARKFIDSGRFLQAVALGQQITAVSHPAYSTHRQYSEKDLAKMGIYEGTLRISVGAERQRKLLQDMHKALSL